MKQFRSPWHRPYVSSTSINRYSLMVCQGGRGDMTGPSLSHRRHMWETSQDGELARLESRTRWHRTATFRVSDSPAPRVFCVFGCVPPGRLGCPRTCTALLCPSLTWPPTSLLLSVALTHTHTHTHTHTNTHTPTLHVTDPRGCLL